MSSETFWLTIKALAAYLDGDRNLAEQTLDQLEAGLLNGDEQRRRIAGEEMTVIIAQLSRLKLRMVDKLW